MASSSSFPLMKDEEPRNWAELPLELTSSILLRLSTIEILQNAQKVCRAWRRVCKDPSMWRKIDLGNHGICGYNYDIMCRHAVDRSEGGLVEINMENFCNDSLLSYISDRSSNLRCLRLEMCHPLTNEGLVDAVMKFPFLENLEIQHCYSQLNLNAIGHSCPLLKTLKVNRRSFRYPDFECDDDALAIAETMPELRYLELIGNKLTNTGLNAILDNCHHLEHLDLRHCFNIILAGDIKKRCFERIKALRCPEDSTADHPMSSTLHDTDSLDEFLNEEEDDAFGWDHIIHEYIMSAINLT